MGNIDGLNEGLEDWLLPWQSSMFGSCRRYRSSMQEVAIFAGIDPGRNRDEAGVCETNEKLLGAVMIQFKTPLICASGLSRGKLALSSFASRRGAWADVFALVGDRRQN